MTCHVYLFGIIRRLARLTRVFAVSTNCPRVTYWNGNNKQIIQADCEQVCDRGRSKGNAKRSLSEYRVIHHAVTGTMFSQRQLCVPTTWIMKLKLAQRRRSNSSWVSSLLLNTWSMRTCIYSLPLSGLPGGRAPRRTTDTAVQSDVVIQWEHARITGRKGKKSYRHVGNVRRRWHLLEEWWSGFSPRHPSVTFAVASRR